MLATLKFLLPVRITKMLLPISTVLAAAQYAVAAAVFSDPNDVANFQPMKPRPAKSRRNLPQAEDFPAGYLQGFESHHWKRQESDTAVDADLQTRESWYWGSGKTCVRRHLAPH